MKKRNSPHFFNQTWAIIVEKKVCKQFLIRCCFILALFTVSLSNAQTDTIPEKQKSLFSVGLGVQHGFIFAHTQEVQNTQGARPTGIEAIAGWQRNDAAALSLCRCYPRQGVLLAYYDYDVDLLGKSLSAAYFLEPTYQISNRVFFSFKGAAGFSYLSNPFDSISNPTNQSYSNHVSFYLLFGVGLWVQLSDHWSLNPSINYQHVSNGGTRQPNKGINWPTAGIAVSYQPVFRPWHIAAPTQKQSWRDFSNQYAIALLSTVRRGYDEEGERERYLVSGLAFQAGRQISNLSMLTLGAEAYLDGEVKEKLRRDGLDASPVKAGVLVGHEFLLGRFQFSQRLGVYAFDQTPYYDRIFHRWGLQFQVTQQFSAGFNLLAHRHIAEFVDFRVAYTFGNR